MVCGIYFCIRLFACVFRNVLSSLLHVSLKSLGKLDVGMTIVERLAQVWDHPAVLRL